MLSRITILIASVLLALSSASCKKQAGVGGTSSIAGDILVRQYDLSFSSFDEEYAGADEEVYIVFGDNVSPNDRIRTSYDGKFRFNYLRPGLYTIYTYSKDSAAIVGPPANPNAPNKAVIVEVEITKQHQDVDIGTLVILKN